MTQKEINTSLFVGAIFLGMFLGPFIYLGISALKSSGSSRIKKV